MTMTTSREKDVIIIDDDLTTSGSDLELVAPPPDASRRARATSPMGVKRDPDLADIEEKVLWTDDSESEDGKKARGKRKRRSVAGNTRKGPRGRPPKKPRASGTRTSGNALPSSDDELTEAGPRTIYGNATRYSKKTYVFSKRPVYDCLPTTTRFSSRTLTDRKSFKSGHSSTRRAALSRVGLTMT